MPGNIKGIIVEIGGDTSKLQKALNKGRTIKSETRNIKSKYRYNAR